MGKEIKVATYTRSTSLIKGRFQKIKGLVAPIAQTASEQKALSQVQLRSLTSYLNELKKKKLEFELNFQRILDYADEDEISEETLSKDMDEVNDLYISVVAQIESILPPDEPSSPASFRDEGNTSFRHASLTQPTVRLPQLDLKPFDGNIANWTTFINLFDTSVHHNSSLSSVNKMQYLLSVLSGDALNLIKSMQISAANYPIAYQLLKNRYQNSRRLITLHLNAILDLPSVSTGNTQGLRNFLNSFNENTQSLQALQSDITNSTNPLLSAHLLRKLDQELRRGLEGYRSSLNCDPHTLPTVNHIIDFLDNECLMTEDASLHFPHSSQQTASSQAAKPHKSSFNKPHTAPRAHALVAAHNEVDSDSHIPAGASFRSRTHAHPHSKSAPPCFACCKEGHKIYSCPLFLSKTPNERVTIVKSHKRCYSCLGSHMIDSCTSKGLCNTCKKRHHTLLHFEKKSSLTPAAQPTLPGGSVVASAQNSFTTPASANSTVLLGTALIKLTSPNGNIHVFRALLDSGSQLSFISERAVQLLNAPRINSTHNIMGISTTQSQTKGFTNLDLSSLSDKNIASQHAFHILNRISADLPRATIKPEVWQLTRQYVLADPTFHLPGKVDVLLGCALYPLLLTQQQYSLGPDLPHMIGTHLGFVAMGTAPCDLTSSHNSYVVSCHSALESQDLHTSLQRFWLQEEPPTSSKKSMDEELCDQHFSRTHSRSQDGRYIVRLPFKPDHSPLGSSLNTAERRFASLEKKFQSQPEFQSSYVQFMDEYRSQGHMVQLKNPDLTLPHYYLPHHGVVKETSSTTKLRTVFDASSLTSTGISLNSVLLTGRKLQTNICDILLHFRSHVYVFSCDIRQMYRQILVHPEDQKYQLILWRDQPTQPITTYQLTTVTYGMNCSPYLAIRTLYQLAEDEGHHFPEAAAILKSHTYVDDVIAGADTEEDASRLQQQLVSLLHKGGFQLRKWTSNSPALLNKVAPDHRETPVFLHSTNKPLFSILGLQWSPKTDSFTYSINWPVTPPTKRRVLSLIAQIYDPCGYLSPFIMLTKCYMQLLWSLGLQWDEPLNPELTQKWQTIVSDTHAISAIEIPRPLRLSSSKHVELHGFSDASESGFAAVVYLKCLNSDDDVTTRLIMSKTRVAPLKRVTLPRLELCAAHLLAQLMSYCASILDEASDHSKTFLWCDSSVALTWLQTPPYKLKTYVANRVAQTQELIPVHCWRYIPSGENPADCASRGILASQLLKHPLWWSGPSWLALPPAKWPNRSFTPTDLSSSEEVKNTPLTVLTVTSTDAPDFFNRFSSWTRLLHAMAHILRFVYNCRHSTRKKGFLSTQELSEARLKIFKIVQQSAFSEDLSSLKSKSNLSCSSRLKRLNPFLDENNVIRVGGRLNRSSLSHEAKHPVVLPKKHHVVELLIQYYHNTHLHAGPQLTQSLMSQSVWILSARSEIRSQILKCVRCFRVNPRNTHPLMGDLPSPRVTPARPFSSIGIDFTGPFSIKIVNLRSVKHIKAYICVFVCMATKAMHLEVVDDLTTEAFIASLTRFVSRRGRCNHIYSDCGTNFVGARNTLQKLINSTLFSKESQAKLHHHTTSQEITFHFNPPAAPHQGGLWESAVKGVKHHLRRVMGETILTLMEFITLTHQIEAMLNSRPLTPLSSDPTDLSALTPGHFLIGAPLTSVPEPDHQEVPLNRLKRWQQVQALQQRLWKRWQLDYLHTLQQRFKWHQNSQNIKVGDLILIHDTSTPLTWPLARVIKLHPGEDGVVRVVDIKTQNGTLTRPVVKVFPLPCN